jgi:L-proline amide hydrolase
MSDFVQWDGHKTWYRVVGDLNADKAPLLFLHGGPGVPHDYLESLADLSENGRPVVFYD